jgi:hypothetical protein
VEVGLYCILSPGRVEEDIEFWLSAKAGWDMAGRIGCAVYLEVNIRATNRLKYLYRGSLRTLQIICSNFREPDTSQHPEG